MRHTRITVGTLLAASGMLVLGYQFGMMIYAAFGAGALIGVLVGVVGAIHHITTNWGTYMKKFGEEFTRGR